MADGLSSGAAGTESTKSPASVLSFHPSTNASTPVLSFNPFAGGPPRTRTAALAAKLQALEKAAPPWLLSPSRLSMEHGSDGQLVLLGTGAYARVYAGYLAPPQPAAQPDGGSSGESSQPAEPPLHVAIKVGGWAEVAAAAAG